MESPAEACNDGDIVDADCANLNEMSGISKVLGIPESRALPDDQRFRQLSFQLFGKTRNGYEGPFVNVSRTQTKNGQSKIGCDELVSKPKKTRVKRVRKQSDALGNCLICYAIVTRADRLNFLGRPPMDKLVATIKERSDDLKEFVNLLSSSVSILHKAESGMGSQSTQAVFQNAVSRLKAKPWCLCSSCSLACDLLLSKQRAIIKLQQEVQDLKAKFTNAVRLSRAFTVRDPNFKGIVHHDDGVAGVDKRTKMTLNMKTVDMVRKCLLGGNASWRKAIDPLINHINNDSEVKRNPESLVDVNALLNSSTECSKFTSQAPEKNYDCKSKVFKIQETTAHNDTSNASMPYANKVQIKVETEALDEDQGHFPIDPIFSPSPGELDVTDENVEDANSTVSKHLSTECLNLAIELDCDSANWLDNLNPGTSSQIDLLQKQPNAADEIPSPENDFVSDHDKEMHVTQPKMELDQAKPSKTTPSRKTKKSNGGLRKGRRPLSGKPGKNVARRRKTSKSNGRSPNPSLKRRKNDNAVSVASKRTTGAPGERRRPISELTDSRHVKWRLTHGQHMSCSAYAKMRRADLSEEQKVDATQQLPGRAKKGGPGLKTMYTKDGKTYCRGIEVKTNSDGMYVCPYLCDRFKTYPRKNALVVHINRYHVDTSTSGWPCQHCDKKFYYHNELEMHIKQKHSAGFQCEICGATLRVRSSLHYHKQVKHFGIKPHVCEHCGKGFATKKDMTIHVRRHTGERPYICEICADTFVEKQSMKLHMRRKHPEASEREEKPQIDINSTAIS